MLKNESKGLYLRLIDVSTLHPLLHVGQGPDVHGGMREGRVDPGQAENREPRVDQGHQQQVPVIGCALHQPAVGDSSYTLQAACVGHSSSHTHTHTQISHLWIYRVNAKGVKCDGLLPKVVVIWTEQC